MDEITGPVIGISLVLAAVFIPTAFIPGLTGQFFRQFALTIATAALFSATNALTMAPGAGGHLDQAAHGGAARRGEGSPPKGRHRRSARLSELLRADAPDPPGGGNDRQ